MAKEVIFLCSRFPELTVTVVHADNATKYSPRVVGKVVNFKRGPLNKGYLHTADPQVISSIRANSEFRPGETPLYNDSSSSIYEITEEYFQKSIEYASFQNDMNAGKMLHRGPLTSNVIAPHSPLEPAPFAPSVPQVPEKRGPGRPRLAAV